MEQKDRIRPFLDAEGKIKALPQRQNRRHEVLAYLAEKFIPGTDYTEREVNAICDLWHTFGDYFLLRRELVDSGLLCRMRDGSRYWRPDTPAEKTADAADLAEE
ncbi:MAG: DUF2087 domain-containing protein [Clostridiaceae bacterium]|nr:DUF2087 domain-containing protein [Clostridiaceae bacterium]